MTRLKTDEHGLRASDAESLLILSLPAGTAVATAADDAAAQINGITRVCVCVCVARTRTHSPCSNNKCDLRSASACLFRHISVPSD